MALLEWKDAYRTGFGSIDYEHENLISGINQIFAGGDGDKEGLLTALGEIHALVEAHFALEEKIMRDHNYPAYVSHKQDHERLLDEILDIMDGIEKNGELNATAALGDRMATWFGDHFASLDKNLHTMIGG